MDFNEYGQSSHVHHRYYLHYDIWRKKTNRQQRRLAKEVLAPRN